MTATQLLSLQFIMNYVTRGNYVIFGISLGNIPRTTLINIVRDPAPQKSEKV